MRQPGVIAAGVPGAGGFDAVFALALTPEAAAGVKGYWEAWTGVPGMAVTVLESRNDVQGGVTAGWEPRPSL